eukprot:CAMPEP_0182417084 /NCGR_PEP_ID=MMETSP1167-20130531/1500_1 /TAXON_ID=2988 /ORGANISM="Mallomonas Sp, Strain CCMP3275" /LENGTH=632 /DNA_ID=CAMNT_0024590377 /DNA_START=110 /DNA_END=2009 /DNA_ORIENTATION=-
MFKSNKSPPAQKSDGDVVATVVQGHTFTIATRYEPKKILGRGSFGVVTTAFDKVRNENIAIKRIRPFANDEWDARHTLREIRLMKLLGSHPNIISLHDLSVFEEKAELYMMMELMDCDLHRIIQSKQPLNDLHFKCFAKQMLEGIRAMHSVGVFHRDLKPGNILVSKDCQLRITDFGLARFMDDLTLAGQNEKNPMTEYVVTRWYRCPELLLAPQRPYSEAVDIWSVGCILGELLHRKPLFPGKSHANQIQLILEVRGYNSPEDIGFPLSSEASSFLDRRCQYTGVPLRSFIPEASNEAVEMLDALLNLNPAKRPSAAQALADDYLRDAQVLCDYDSVSLIRPDREFFEFEQEKFSLEELREMVYHEVRTPCGPYVSSRLTKSGGMEVEPANQSYQPRKDDDDNHDNGEGPRSQARTQVARISQEKLTDNSSGGGGGGTKGKQRRGSEQQRSTGDSGPDSLRSISSDPVDKQAAIPIIRSGSLLAKVKVVPGRNTPSTPSPRRMETIVQKDRRQKRLFQIQNSKRQSDQVNGPEVDDKSVGSAVSARSTGSSASVKSFGMGLSTRSGKQSGVGTKNNSGMIGQLANGEVGEDDQKATKGKGKSVFGKLSHQYQNATTTQRAVVAAPARMGRT